MYAPYFGLRQEPFSIAPDPHFLFMSAQHREALAHLLYGVAGGGGFVVLTGEIGAGKTTVCRAFLEQVPAHCKVAYVFNPRLDALELLQTVCDEFGLTVSARGGGRPTLKDHVDALNTFLLAAHAQGQQSLLIIDEAQALSPEVLEQLRLLTNLETSERKLLQIILIGQPELRDVLARPELEQLAQRVIARWHLPALAAAETAPYVRHRLAVAGATAQLPFEDAALVRVHRLSGGVPRRINLLCDRALLAAYAQGRSRVDVRLVEQAAAEVFGVARSPTRPRGGMWLAAGLGLVLLVGGAALAWRQAPSPPAAVAESTAVAALPRVPGVATPSNASPTPADGTPSDAKLPPQADAAAVLSQAWPDEDAAWRALAALWPLTLAPGDACRAAPSAGAACFRANGGLVTARLLGRPGLLPLRDAGGTGGWVLLTGLSDTEATLQTRQAEVRLPLALLAPLWRGDFATLWRLPPAADPGAIAAAGPGAFAVRAAAPAWLTARLDAAGVAAVPLGPGTRAGPALDERVRRFQIAQGLPPDGRAGPMTLMRLQLVAGDDEPRLRLR